MHTKKSESVLRRFWYSYLQCAARKMTISATEDGRDPTATKTDFANQGCLATTETSCANRRWRAATTETGCANQRCRATTETGCAN